jgi:adenosylcobinamide kinase/adenosylcobinamide-phosphate guanylyltransferase
MIGLILGGAASGKSEFAEKLACALPGKRYYLATMEPFGPEAAARIARHQALRADKGFETLECYGDLSRLKLPEKGVILLECLGNLLANEMFSREQPTLAPKESILQGLHHLAEQADSLIIVSNDVFAQGGSHTPESQAYMADLAALHQFLGAKAHLVAEVVCGLPLLHKGVLPCSLL